MVGEHMVLAPVPARGSPRSVPDKNPELLIRAVGLLIAAVDRPSSEAIVLQDMPRRLRWCA